MNQNWSYGPERPNSGQNWWFFLSHVILNFDGWLWKIIRHLFYTMSSFVHHFIAIGASNWSYSPEMPNLVNIDDFLSRVTLKFDRWLCKQIALPHQDLCIISSPYINLNWSYGPQMPKWGFDFCDLDLWPLTLTFCMGITSVMVITLENFMMIPWWKHNEQVSFKKEVGVMVM